MSISLVKGQKIDLSKGNSGLERVTFGLGWDTNKYDGQENFDLDVSAFLVGENEKVSGEQDFIFYGQPQHPSMALIYSGDNQSGEGEGDDETMEVNLSKIPPNIQKIIFCATIYDAESRLQNFGMVSNSYIRAFDDSTNELFNFDLGEDFSTETGVIAGELYRHNGNWKFNAVGSGVVDSLIGICKKFGVNIN
ncbi:MAG: TerD family protein [Clostridiales bacterium]|nr:TerD family protein [Clostridiales bacterium]